MSMIVVAVILSAIVFVLYRRIQFVRKVNLLPSPFPKPSLGIIGHFIILKSCLKHGLFGITETMFRFFMSIPKMYPHESGIMVIWLGHLPHIALTTPESVESIFGDYDAEHTHKGMAYVFIQPWIGDSILTAVGEKWKKTRKLLTPSFHFKVLEGFLPIMNSNANIMTDILSKESRGDSNGVVADLSNVTVGCALDILCETAMGVRVGSMTDPNSVYPKNAAEFEYGVAYRAARPHLIFNWVYFNLTQRGREDKQRIKIMNDFTNGIILKRKKELQSLIESGKYNLADETTKVKEPMVDILLRQHLKNPDSFTLEDIRQEVDVFILAGHETTAMAVTHAVWLLGLHPEFQERIHEELDNLADDQHDGDHKTRNLNLDDIRTRLPFTEAVVKETLRLYPSLPLLQRHLTKDVKIGEHVIPKGCFAVFSPGCINRDPRHWRDPEVFDPTRFLNKESRHPFSWIPFSAGIRSCIGQKYALMEAVVLVGHILRKFKVTSLDSRDKVPHALEIVARPVVPIRVKLQERA